MCIIQSFTFMGTKATEAAKKAKITFPAVTLQVLPPWIAISPFEVKGSCIYLYIITVCSIKGEMTRLLRAESMAVLKHNITLDTWVYLALIEAGLD